MIYTFYSYKGGVGRSMALANVAELFYQEGLKVLMVDWDLEAPGLERFFPVETDKVLSHPGVMDMLLDYKYRMAQLPTQGAEVGEIALLLPLGEVELYLLDVYPGERGEGRLWLLPAGKRAGEHFARYASLVRTFDWQDFYQNWEGELYFEWLRQQFRQMADVVLIDSRTGVTEMGGVCAYQLADTVVMFCAPHGQSLEGTYEMAWNFKRPEVRELRHGRPLEVLVVPARVEDRAETRLLNEFRREFAEKFSGFLPESLSGKLGSLWELKIPHVPYYAFNEVVAVREKGEARSEAMVEAFYLLAKVLYPITITVAPPVLTGPGARVLIVDKDPQVRRDLQTLLAPLGYRVQVARGAREALLEQAITIARTFRPHVAVVELRLLDDQKDDRSGFELLEKLQSARCILYSAYLTPEVTREALRTHAVTDVLSKSESPEILLRVIADATRASAASVGDLSIHLPSPWTSQRIIQALFGEDTDALPGMVDDVLSQLFPGCKSIALEMEKVEKAVSPFVARGLSTVFKAQPDDLEPVVVKLAPVERVRDEAGIYQEYVRGRLVGQFYAQLERTVEFWDLGGAVYSFLGSSLRALPSFTVFYREETDPQVILRPLRHLFTEVWIKHYGQVLPDRHISLFQTYGEGLGLKERLERFSSQEERMAFPDFPVSLINPIPWVLRHAGDSLMPGIRQAITHGDLHGDNLFTDGEHAWVIDFERTGPGHILRDFVNLEVDIVTRLIGFPEDDLSLFYDLAVVLSESSEPRMSARPTAQLLGNPETRKALEVITGLRSLAREVTDYSDFREYLWGLLLYAVFVASLVSEETPQRDRALLLGSVLCGRLRHWGKEWPPKSWPPIARDTE